MNVPFSVADVRTSKAKLRLRPASIGIKTCRSVLSDVCVGTYRDDSRGEDDRTHGYKAIFDRCRLACGEDMVLALESSHSFLASEDDDLNEIKSRGMEARRIWVRMMAIVEAGLGCTIASHYVVDLMSKRQRPPTGREV